MSIFERSVTCSFFQELYSHIDKNSGEKFEDMFLGKIANKGTSLIISTLLSYSVSPCDTMKGTDEESGFGMILTSLR